ncbi:MAG: hypothetical protein IJ846_02320 [Alphaproteobacteria bacterium]|nr:hypothetical protein [Alphaproteobacteria bacterium]
MKKYILFVLAGFLFLAGSNELHAKAVKLGRSTGSGTSSGYQFQPATGGRTTTFCPANCTECNENICTRCKSDLLLSGGKCVTCPNGQTCDGTENTGCASGYYSYAGSCKSCPDNASSCSGSKVTCQAGYYRTENNGYSCTACEEGYACSGGNSNTHTACATGTFASGKRNTSCTSCTTLFGSNVASACCKSDGTLGTFTCASGYRKSGNSCVSNCTGVNCASGYTPTATGTGCKCVKSGSTSSGSGVCIKEEWFDFACAATRYECLGSFSVRDYGIPCGAGTGYSCTGVCAPCSDGQGSSCR